MVVHVPCPGEPSPSLLSPLLRLLPVTGTTSDPVFLVSAKLVFISVLSLFASHDNIQGRVAKRPPCYCYNPR